ncbi:transcriptional family [Leptolyngbya sp. Heron Island J]|uniref:helix-turn-helix domain-containing protein n=1 Tax=Leptolyngbya sp. Heron Island J TaxID=1385935 RepID=UPI0003B9F6A0|nr:AraC family transcriptional regulator [Leptolyngbya sp. Heron Island J]ESA31950.1 transcriptional family [Leptolyngbya sp. Heron Island J]
MSNLLENQLCPPLRSSQPQGWKNIVVEEFRQSPGQETYKNLTEHTLCISLNPRPSRLSQTVNSRRHNSPCVKGDICIVPAGLSFFWQWDQDDQYIRIRIAPELLQRVAEEATEVSSNRADLCPEFRVRHLQIEQLGDMLLGEIKNGGLAGQLYVDSLTNALAVQLLRDFSAVQPCATAYGGGLSDRQLMQVTDYIHDCLGQNIGLSDLSELLKMSESQFSRRFKQSMGVAPYQYLLQQRIEQAKQLLKTTNLSVMEIAMVCGFSSHSHLGKLIRQYTGLSPKAYRK